MILACGGFEANPEMRVRYLGSGWDLCRVRGTRHNMGEGILAALAIGARPFGNWSSCHACEWDISAPPYGDRWVLDNFQKHCYPLGMMVNINGKRFVDEGDDFATYTYAKYGREIMNQPRRTAIQIFDAKTWRCCATNTASRSDQGRIRHHRRARRAARPRSGGLEKTVSEYNAACSRSRLQSGDPGRQGRARHLAAEVELGAADQQAALCRLRHHLTGITFTFGGLQINTSGEVQDMTDQPIPGLYAAGELVGGLFYENYPGGTGLMSGSVFGKLAGESAAAYVGAKDQRSVA